MATQQEVLQHMTGHRGGVPMQLSWNTHFTQVQQARIAGRTALTDAPFRASMNFSTRPDANGKIRFLNVHVTVTMNRGASWVVNGQQTPALLNHEQGHFNITWLAARELCRKMLDYELDASVLNATHSGSTAQVMQKLRQEFQEMERATQRDIDRLNALYDSMGQTNHGANARPQTEWDRFLTYVIQNSNSDMNTLLMIGGGTPTGF
jgi:predicted secreted Zn-dependent protease